MMAAIVDCIRNAIFLLTFQQQDGDSRRTRNRPKIGS
jgi:hypothetical protein